MASTRWAGSRATSRRQMLGRRRTPVSNRPEVRQHIRPFLGGVRIPQQRPRLPPVPPLGQHRPQVKDYILGSKGVADVFGNSITGENKWCYRGRQKTNMYQVEHDEMFAAIRAGKPINNGEAAARKHIARPDGPHGRLHRCRSSRRT